MNKDHRSKIRYNHFLLLVAGLGGLLYGIDVGIIAGALPYLENTVGWSAGQLSVLVAAVLLGSVISTLFAGLLADSMGRKRLMLLSGLFFVVSIPIIALSHSYEPMLMGRLLQGGSAGSIGVVVPLYLAECLAPSSRGKGTGVFQWLLTLGIVAAALIGYWFSSCVEQVARTGGAVTLLAFEDRAWRGIFWASLPPGILFVIGTLFLSESPRWLFQKGQIDLARTALLRSRSDQEAEVELREIENAAARAQSASAKLNDSLFRRKYVVPFLLACIILACNQATGANSIIGYNTAILLQGGLADKQAHLGYVILTGVNFIMTSLGVMLVDRKGRKFLLSLGSAGMIPALLCVGLMFRHTEKHRIDCRNAVQVMVTTEQALKVTYDRGTAARFLARSGESGRALSQRPTTLILIYSYGDFEGVTPVARSDDRTPRLIEITRQNSVPHNRVLAFLSNPFGSVVDARAAPLRIDRAWIMPVPEPKDGWLIAGCLFVFMAFFAVGPGICVWLALSELMPTRIRSNGMSAALLINQGISTAIAAVFLPTVGNYGYSTMFLVFAGCAVVYFITVTFYLPETKGKTLEEIEQHFETKVGRSG
jgi:MFS family permease